APAAAAAAGAPATAAAPAGEVVYAEPALGLAIPSPEEWEIPVRCYRCQGEYTVPFDKFQAGVVFRCPHCLGSLVRKFSVVQAVREAIEAFHDKWAEAFERFHEKRQREIELFEERQRAELEAFQAKLGKLALRERAPGAPTKRKPFFSF